MGTCAGKLQPENKRHKIAPEPSPSGTQLDSASDPDNNEQKCRKSTPKQKPIGPNSSGYGMVEEDMNNKHYLIEMLRAVNVPKMDIASESDPYIVLKILNKRGKQRGNKIKSLYRHDSANPVWNCYRTFCANSITDSLQFEIYDKDFTTNDDLIGKCVIKMCDLFINIDNEDDGDIVQDFTVKLSKKKHQNKYSNTCKVFYRLSEMQYHPNSVTTKTFFFIRHGESKWNSAQSNKEIVKMYKERDHPLNKDGIEQAMQFHDLWETQSKLRTNDQDLTDFMNCDAIYASPLCRATQTALLTLLKHPTLQQKGLVFARNLREIKTAGGADTLGELCGKEQHRKCIENIILYQPMMKDELNEIKIDYNDCQQKWWSSTVDSKHDFKSRLTDWMYYLKYSKQNNLICVGHSLWIRRFFKIFVAKNDITQYSARDLLMDMMADVDDNADDDCKHDKLDDDDDQRIRPSVLPANYDFERALTEKKENMSLMNDLKSKKMANTGCIRVDVSFSDKFDEKVKITDVKLLFGTNLIGK